MARWIVEVTQMYVVEASDSDNAADMIAGRTPDKERISGVHRAGPALSARQEEVLLELRDSIEVWYHDVGARTAEALLRAGYVHEVTRLRCNTKGHKHAGYLGITPAGRAALRF